MIRKHFNLQNVVFSANIIQIIENNSQNSTFDLKIVESQKFQITWFHADFTSFWFCCSCYCFGCCWTAFAVNFDFDIIAWVTETLITSVDITVFGYEFSGHTTQRYTLLNWKIENYSWVNILGRFFFLYFSI